MGKYFGTDGIRGKANQTLTADLAFKVGRGLSVLNIDTVVIGYDTRQSNYMLAYSVASGAMSKGINVIMAGVITTPGLIYYSGVKHLAGVMITASHNPYYDNGLKVVYDGAKLLDDKQKVLEDYIDSDDRTNSATVGTVLDICDVKDTYLSFLESQVSDAHFKIVLDCAHGAASFIAPEIFAKASKRVEIIGNNPDGININNGFGSTHIDRLKTSTLRYYATVGFAFDGDGDRVIAVDGYGNVIDGDKIVYIIANYLSSIGKLKENKVVLTKMSNLGIINQLKAKGIDVVLTDVGDKYVLEELLANNYSIGGENSGHIIMPELFKSGDGILIALYLTKILALSRKSLYDLSRYIEMYPDHTENIPVNDKSIINNSEIITKVKEITNALGNNGKVILRASGTENLIRVTVMAKTNELVKQYSQELIDLVNKYNK